MRGIDLMKIQCSSARYVYEGTGLTEKQAKTCLWLAEGKTQRETAIIECVSHQSIDKRISHVRELLEVNTTIEVITLLCVRGYIKAKEVQP
ncbi:helix-turn-helix transcriptional regulator [Endozoicomonas ascidiicola]|uniref:helix-turn-helix transcriptional regulator n=1 Tax=Endozoicomonas ascidiicola TaxID=1698521 RepID=UPI0008374F8F|nr:hypothetical protein [Endozoicomonas ascidiicola]